MVFVETRVGISPNEGCLTVSIDAELSERCCSTAKQLAVRRFVALSAALFRQKAVSAHTH